MKRGRGAFAPLVYLKNALHPTPQGQVLYGGIMFSYYAACAATSFVAPYLTQQGLTGGQVGTVMAIINLFGILSTPVAGSLSDKLHSPRRVLIACLAAASVLFLCVGLFGTQALFAMPLATILLPVWSFFKTPLNSLMDSLTVQIVNQKRTFTYGSVRCVGSLGYSLTCILLGRIAAHTGTQTHTFFFYGVLNLFPIALLVLAKRDDEPKEASPERAPRQKQKGGVRLALSSFYFCMFLISYMLVSVPVYCLTTFLPYKLTEIVGNSDSFGTLIALKAFMEIPALLLGGRVIQRFGVRRVMFWAMCIFALEQGLYFCAASVSLVTFALLMHGATFGLFMSCAVSYIYMVTPHEASASAQTVAGALTSVAAILGSLAGGLLVDFFGVNGYYAFTLVLQILAGVVFVLSIPIGRRLGHKLNIAGN